MIQWLAQPSSFAGTLILVPIFAALGWAYGFVGYVGYARQISSVDSQRSRAALTTAAVGAGLVFVFRHVINGQALDALLVWFHDTLWNSNPLVMFFFALPLALLVMVGGLAVAIGGFVGGAVGIARTFYYLPGFFIGVPIVWHWFLVEHPAEGIIAPALESGGAVDTKALAVTLAEGAGDWGTKPTHQYEQDAEKARRLKEKLDRDTEIAEATIRRERARAALLDAEQEVEEAKRRARKKQ